MPAAGMVAALLLIGLALAKRWLRVRSDLEDITAAQVELLEHAALTDSLTGLRNRRAFHEDLTRDVERCRRSGAPLSLLLLDLDGLKQTNDSRGHQAGDERLRTLAACVRDSSRVGDAAYRLGGDEFAVLLAGEHAWGAFEMAQRLQEEYGVACPPGAAGVSAGVAELGQPPDKEALIGNADAALIEAKRSGRRGVVYTSGLELKLADPSSEAHEQHLTTLATALARAVDAKDSYTRSARPSPRSSPSSATSSASAPSASGACGWPGCSTTSARSACPTRCCTRQGR